MLDLRPKLVAASQRLQEPISHCDVVADMDAVRRKVTRAAAAVALSCNKMTAFRAFLLSLKRALLVISLSNFQRAIIETIIDNCNMV